MCNTDRSRKIIHEKMVLWACFEDMNGLNECHARYTKTRQIEVVNVLCRMSLRTESVVIQQVNLSLMESKPPFEV